MKDWRKALEYRTIEIRHDPDIDVAALPGSVDLENLDWDEREEIEQTYRDALAAELEPLVTDLEIETEEGKAAGGDFGFDPVTVFITVVNTAASLYVLLAQIRRVIDAVKRHDKANVQIDGTAAWIIAWHEVAPEDSGVVVEIDHVGQLSSMSADGHQSRTSWLVSLRADGAPKLVLVALDGSVTGVTDGIDFQGLSSPTERE